MSGWVKLHRQALDNGWLSTPVLWTFFCFCLLKARHKVGKVIVGYQEIDLQPGQFIYGAKAAGSVLGLSPRQLRTCITRLKSTGTLTVETTNKFSVITVVNWDIYQSACGENDSQNDAPADKPTSVKRQSSDKPTTTNKNRKTDKTENFKPPALEEVEAYCKERQNSVDPHRWYNHYTSNGWKVGKNPMKDWKAAVRTWENGDRKPSSGNTFTPVAPGQETTFSGSSHAETFKRYFASQQP